jgi:hypothetical protein
VAHRRVAVHRRRGRLRLLRVAALPARALRRPHAYQIAGPRGRDRRRRADPRRDRRALDPRALPPPHVGAHRDHGGSAR